MKVAVISLNNPNVYPSLFYLAEALARSGADVQFLSSVPPTWESTEAKLSCIQILKLRGLVTKIPGLRSNYHGIFSMIRRSKPDWVVAQHEYLLPALTYKALENRTKIAGYFSDYYKGRWHTELLKGIASSLDAYIDICDVRLQWRQNDWSRLRADTFIIRQAPFRQDVDVPENHNGSARIVFTGSKYVLGLNRDRLSRFLSRLCENGISVDWYLPGVEEVRVMARSLVAHPLFAVRDPVEKSYLLATLGQYDAGLHWAPMVEKDYDPDYFMSAASNKIGEYIAAGLMVAHAGNPGLAYLPDEVCTVFDPTDPEAGADQLAVQLADRATVERKRQASLRYHHDEMNFEAQAAPFIKYIMKNK